MGLLGRSPSVGVGSTALAGGTMVGNTVARSDSQTSMVLALGQHCWLIRPAVCPEGPEALSVLGAAPVVRVFEACIKDPRWAYMG